MSAPTHSSSEEAKAPVSALVIDMDGVIWRGTQALPGLRAFFELLHDQKIPYLLATNNASQSPQSYALRLENHGLEINSERILTSGLASSMMLLARFLLLEPMSCARYSLKGAIKSPIKVRKPVLSWLVSTMN